MKRNFSVFSQIAIVLFGFGVLVFMLWEPHLEGRNANAGLFQIYFNDPFLAYAYMGSIPFFLSLYHAFKALGQARQNEVPLLKIAKSLRMIKYCAGAMIGFAALGEVFLFLGESDDRAGGVFIGLLIILGAIVMAAAATTLERKLKA